jgi:hypothetical protein
MFSKTLLKHALLRWRLGLPHELRHSSEHSLKIDHAEARRTSLAPAPTPPSFLLLLHRASLTLHQLRLLLRYVGWLIILASHFVNIAAYHPLNSHSPPPTDISWAVHD